LHIHELFFIQYFDEEVIKMVAIPTSLTKRALSKLTVTDGVTTDLSIVMLLLSGVVLWWLVACMYALGFKMESCGGFDLQKG
jgi:hypothetical protein